MNIHVEVNQSHIDSGTRDSARSCPVALALRDRAEAQFNKQVGVSVGLGSIWIAILPDSKGYLGFVAKVPPNVDSFIRHFDAGDFSGVQPFGFDLEFNDTSLEAE